MSQLMPLEVLLLNLKQEISPVRRREYLPKERALQLLKEWTGQDFGDDVAAWERWIAEHGENFPRR